MIIALGIGPRAPSLPVQALFQLLTGSPLSIRACVATNFTLVGVDAAPEYRSFGTGVGVLTQVAQKGLLCLDTHGNMRPVCWR